MFGFLSGQALDYPGPNKSRRAYPAISRPPSEPAIDIFGEPYGQRPLAGGTNNNTAADKTAYTGMGQTWSVPAMANVVSTPEFVLYTGSGYGSGSNAAAEGTTFYTLDTLTGNVVASVNVGDRASAAFDNALVAGPSGFNADQLATPDVSKPAVTATTRV